MTQKELKNWLFLMGFVDKPLSGHPDNPNQKGTITMINGKITVFIYERTNTTRAYLNKQRLMDTASTPQELEKLRNAIERHL